MTTIDDIFKRYSQVLDHLDLELLVAHAIGKSREFVLAYPEYKIPTLKIKNLKLKIARRIRREPIAHILKEKEFFGLDLEVNKHTLIPRPETELLVEMAQLEASSVISNQSSICIIDVGTGSGNIIISIAKQIQAISHQSSVIKFIGIDMSKEALKVARRNSKRHSLDKKIKFLHGNLLEPLIKIFKSNVRGKMSIVIIANLPYLSNEIFQSAPIDVKKFEPKSALYSSEKGLSHYRKLFKQIKEMPVTCHLSHVTCYLEFSPEQKILLEKLINNHFPKSKTSFHKDLAGKWRIAAIKISNS